MSKLAEIINHVLALDPPAEAVEFEGNWHTWGELTRTIEQLDRALLAAGLGPGARVGGVLRNTPGIAAAMVGIVKSNHCLVAINPNLPDSKLAEEVRTLRPGALVATTVDWQKEGVLRAALSIGCLGIEITGDAHEPVRIVRGLESLSGKELQARAESGVGVEMLTSGTTGAPKRIPLKTFTLERAILSAGAYEKRDEDFRPRLHEEVRICNAPFAHISGLFAVFNTILSGRKLCLLPRFTVETWVDAVRRHKPIVAGAPPAALKMLMDANVPRDDLASLRAFRTGTAPLDPALADAFFDRYGIPVLQTYGATEFAGAIAGWSLGDYYRYRSTKRASVGRVNRGLNVRVVNPITGEELARGEQGILEVRANFLGDGTSWIRTTDLASLDTDDFLYIHGRADNAIIRGGFKIFPDQVREALECHPAIREAAVIGVPDARLGQVPVAAYVVKAGVAAPSDSDLGAFLRDRLLPYQIPTQIRLMDELPRTPSLKVSSPELTKIFELELQR